MGEAARVLDGSALDDAKAAVVEHAEIVKTIFVGIDADVQRVEGWLTREMPMYWKRRVRELEEEVLRCKSKIATKRLAAAPEIPSVVEETIALRRAEAGLENARRKLQRVKQWSVKWRQEAPLYRAACGGLLQAVQRDAPLAVARLSLMRQRLEEYRRLAPVRPGDPPVISSDFLIDADEPRAAEGNTEAS
jgi:hypothetical protein